MDLDIVIGRDSKLFGATFVGEKEGFRDLNLDGEGGVVLQVEGASEEVVGPREGEEAEMGVVEAGRQIVVAGGGGCRGVVVVGGGGGAEARRERGGMARHFQIGRAHV